MDALRLPFFVLAIVAIALAVLVEVGSGFVTGGGSAGGELLQQANALGVTPSSTSGVTEPPGRAIGYLALVDGILLFTVALMGLGLVVPDALHGRVQGVVTLIASIGLIIGAIVLAIVAFVELLIMIALFFATPFGTIAYLAVWGGFPRGDAAVLLALLTFLKLVFAALLLLAQQRFAQNKGLVLLILTSLLLDLVVAFLHGLVPIVMVSIVDSIAAIVIAIVAVIWGIVLAFGSIPAIVKSIRVTLAG